VQGLVQRDRLDVDPDGGGERGDDERRERQDGQVQH
jgi:hypothetical protein